MSNDNITHQEGDARLILDLLESASKLERRLDRALSNTRGITYSEYHLLQALSKMHQHTGMRVELATSVGLTPSAVTRALKPLQKLGYINTVKSDRDARRSLATLTDGGAELLDDAHSVVGDVLSSLTLDPADRKWLSKFLSRLDTP